MARSNRRQSSKVAATSAVHDITLTGKMVVFISWLLAQIQGLNKENSRVVGNILDVFDFEDEKFFVKPSEDYDYELSGYEIQFLLDRIEAEWKAEKVPVIHSGTSHRLEAYLKGVMDAKPDATEAVAE